MSSHAVRSGLLAAKDDGGLDAGSRRHLFGRLSWRYGHPLGVLAVEKARPGSRRGFVASFTQD